ncbi:hypothetical protein JQ599_09755 [Bradyrhizobium diazoefficiens]|nr:hypothetical protein [Bradyrhizobium diazoefficiens]
MTPAVAELGFDTTKKEALIGDGATAGGIRLAKKNLGEILVATQIVANTNDYNPTGLKHARKLIMSTDASRDLTGIVPSSPGDTTDGRELTVYNGGTNNLVLRDQNASSSAANRFDLGGSDITLQPKASVTLRYRTQGGLNRWELDASTAGAAVATGAVIARTLSASALGMSMINGTLAASVAGSALTVAIKTLAGNDPSALDPVYVVFRNETAASGDYVVLTVTAATSLVISSGSSLGASNSVAFRVWIVGFNDAGTFRLGAINCRSSSGILPLAAWGIASSTAEGGAGAADTTQTFYTGAAVAAKAYTPLGYMTWEAGLPAAGTWSAGPTRTQLAGPGIPLPGTPLKKERLSTGAVATGTTIIPHDDTIPQSTEGDLVLSKAIVPSSAANLLRVSAALCLSSTIATYLTAALFQDAGANALTVAAVWQSAAARETIVTLDHLILAGVSVSTTFNIRCGGSGAGTMTVNGNSGSRFYADMLNSYIDIQELMG